MSTWTLLLISSNKSFCDAIKEQLKINNEFNVIDEKNLPSSLDINIDLLILDIDCSDSTNKKDLEEFQKNRFKIPIIILTKKNNNLDKIINDNSTHYYVKKPFRFSILISRIRSQLRQHKKNSLTIGSYIFQPDYKLITNTSGEKIHLTEKEVDIIFCLYNAQQKVISRDTILRKVWGYNAKITTHTLETHIYRLRKKIEHNPANKEIIITENGGYKIIL
ncbi:DNA-binding response regulator [Liberibacter crescens BT-1]|uniref:DNA-binding response regulator n=1 Tax=Liberibacter crescens (strain BT-1) TaxID=1215343 RepID=L0ETQ7_LIBCB|nr:response regulator transcription factor [Liberibacter crescens]AGA64008.1 DNA-binding response regulator [Liberibacter crescens BT-1]AMC12318.1 hypothetical protein RL73_00260 [Liberibacter crescens]